MEYKVSIIAPVYNACKYNKCLPPHLKLLCVFENLNLKNLVLFLLKLWSIK